MFDTNSHNLNIPLGGLSQAVLVFGIWVPMIGAESVGGTEVFALVVGEKWFLTF